MSSLTQQDLQELASFNAAAPSKFIGLLMDDGPGGRANANSIISHLYGQGLPLTVANLDAAVVYLQYVLFWSKGNEPVPVERDTRSRSQKAADGGVTPYEQTRHSEIANGVESGWAKDIREGKEKNAARLAAKAKADQRFRDTHQVVQGINGRQNFAASNELNEQARRRHAEEDARESGKPVAAAKAFRVIPAGETDLRKYTVQELQAHLAKQKGGHLLR
jgi:hypothetical protein